ncbi:MAG: HAMP domain-containing sensor histidine kinase [Polynucleobacter sp.]|nr:HAMP domain-containing sensor histidine kinase [Polynucleobacter sp.]
MSALTIQTLFLLYSALSLSAALLIAALFWKRHDRSALFWIAGCLLTSIATATTVQRADIPLIISYSLMVSFEALSILLFSESLKQLSPLKSDAKFNHITWAAPVLMFGLIEFERHLAGGAISPIMTATTSFLFGAANVFCFYQTRLLSKKLTGTFFLNFLSVIFLLMVGMYLLRILNALIGYSILAFDLKTYNLVIWFFTILFGTIRNLTYIVLRLQLGFTEHGRLNNMNLRLSNLLDERNEMIMSLQKLNKSASINALASTIAHEINQPLGATKLNAQFVEMKLDSDPGNIPLLKEINQSILHDINRVSAIVKNLSRLASNQNNDTGTVNILESINEVVSISKSKIESSHIALAIKCSPNYYININLDEWHQVLINLINNAIDALTLSNTPNKRISISVMKKNDAIWLSIEDNGPGINSGQESQIFELLVSHKKKGTGIGLRLSKNIINRNGGSIVANNLPHGGARFVIELPSA